MLQYFGMKTVQFNFLLIGLLAAVGAIGYFSFSTLNYSSGQDSSKVAAEPTTPVVDPATPAEPIATEPTTPVVAEPAAAGKNQTLIAEIQKLVDEKVQMTSGKSKGTRVGTLQEFLNIYDKKNVEPNNNYGPTTTERVKAFQKAQGVTVSGNAGPQTFTKMIEWLKAN